MGRLKHINPVKMLYIVWSIYLTIVAMPIIIYRAEGAIVAWLFVLGFLGLYTIGYYFGYHVLVIPRKSTKRWVTRKWVHYSGYIVNSRLNLFVLVLALLGITGSLMRGYDLLFFRGIDWQEGVTAVRLFRGAITAAEGIQGGLLQVVSHLLMGVAVFGGVLAILEAERLKFNSMRMAFVSVGFLMGISFLEGARNPIFIAFGFFFSALLVRTVLGKRAMPRIPFRKLVKWIIVPLVIFFFMSVFIEREMLRGRDSYNVLLHLETSFSADIPQVFFDLAARNDVISRALIPFMMGYHYIAHSFSELAHLLTHSPAPGPYWGWYSFHMVGLFMNNVLGFSVPDIHHILASLYRAGTWTTMLGFICVDFGFHLSFLVFLLFGIVSGVTWKMLQMKKNISWEVLAVYILTVILFSPLFLIIAVSNGFAILTGMLFIFIAGYLGLNAKLAANAKPSRKRPEPEKLSQAKQKTPEDRLRDLGSL